MLTDAFKGVCVSSSKSIPVGDERPRIPPSINLASPAVPNSYPTFIRGDSEIGTPLPTNPDLDLFGKDSSLDQAQPEDKPESKLIAGLEGILVAAGGAETPSVTIRLDDDTDIDLWLPKEQVAQLASKLYRRVSVLFFVE